MEKDKSLAKACLLNVLNYLRTKALKRIQNLLSFYRETENIMHLSRKETTFPETCLLSVYERARQQNPTKHGRHPICE